jgi:EAL domain-containing protein (putative c-di-GMP-specific phosphodiesterase class I)
LIGPDDFLTLAHKTGLPPRIDDYVFDFVLDAQTKWANAGLEASFVALNISLDRLQEPSLLQHVFDRMQPHHAISFELLEIAFLDTCDNAKSDTLNQLRAAGIRLELDDFGSGRSSIVALQTVRPDRVKLDQKMVAPIETNPSQILILKALARVAALEGCGVEFEGIETQKLLTQYCSWSVRRSKVSSLHAQWARPRLPRCWPRRTVLCKRVLTARDPTGRFVKVMT